MLICPKCKSEYQKGYTICNDCECELIEIPEVVEADMLVKKILKTNQLIVKLLVFGVVFVIGIIFLSSSIKLGDNEMSNIMKANGGSMDTSKYLIYLEQSIMNYRIIGSILSLLGGLGVLITTNSKS
jgi:hypothetical protein